MCPDLSLCVHRLIIVCAQTYYCVCTDLLLCVYRLIIVCLHTYYFFAQTYYCVCKDYVLKYVIKYVVLIISCRFITTTRPLFHVKSSAW